MQEVIYCAECGEEINSYDNKYEIDGKFYCEDCVHVCEDCGRIELKECGTFKHVEDGNYYICRDCFYDNYFYCMRCNEIHRNSEKYTVYRDDCAEEWCGYCADNYAYYCEECNNLFGDETDGREDNQGLWYCDECIGNGYGDFSPEYPYEIGSYHAHKYAWTNFGTPEIGIELEVDSSNCSDDRIDCTKEIYDEFGDHFVFENDGSLSEGGIEIISQPHSFEEFAKIDWQKLLNICKDYGYRSHDAGNCGLHIHYNRNLFGNTEEERESSIKNMVLFFDKFWGDIVRISRRKRFNYCYKNSTGIEKSDSTKLKAQKAIEFVKSNGNDDRYHAINLTNPGTVEIRIIRGTLNYKSFMACIEFCTNLVKKCRELTEEEALDCNKWLSSLSDQCKEYIKSRKAFCGIDTEQLMQATTQMVDTDDEISTDSLTRIFDIFGNYDPEYAMM